MKRLLLNPTIHKNLIISALVVVLVATALINMSSVSGLRSTNHWQSLYQRNLTQTARQFSQLHQMALTFKEHPDQISALKQSLVKSRKSFKSISFLLNYLDPQYSTDYINGAPLPSLERNSPQLSVLEPEGLQVLDELIFADNAHNHAEAIVSLSNNLVQRFSVLQRTPVQISDRHVFEATRLELIRVFALGLTGFDTPGSVNGIAEAIVSMQALSDAMKFYYPLLQAKNHHQLAKEQQQLFVGAIEYLKEHPDFDQFDRLTYLKKYINPLFSIILDCHQALGIESIYEVTPLNRKHSINYQATNLFQDDFLNPYFYMKLTDSKDNSALIELGQLLFFDPVLSANNERACASCHIPDKGFSDGATKSLAFDFEGTVKRNAPGLVNSVFAEKYFYDLRAELLENQVEHVVTSHAEFRTSFTEIIRKLQSSQEYVRLFTQQFPEMTAAPINKSSITTALASYVASLKGFNSPFDRYVRGEESQIDERVVRGFNLFMGKAACGTCHFAPTFSGIIPPLYHHTESEVLGVPSDSLNTTLDGDLGRYDGALKERSTIYRHSFKTTTVRNVALTGPYMHNGVYSSLEQVVDFYDQGGGIAMGFELPNQTLPANPLNLTDSEKADLVSFMQALTDTSGLTSTPKKLPAMDDHTLNQRKIGGKY